MNNDQKKLIESIFALFIGIDAYVCEPNNSKFIQAKPLTKGSWQFNGIEVKTLTFYYTTNKIMVQGNGVQRVQSYHPGNYFSACKDIVEQVCKLNWKEANEVSQEDLRAAAEFFDSIHDKQERMFTDEELNEHERHSKRGMAFKYGSLEDFI